MTRHAISLLNGSAMYSPLVFCGFKPLAFILAVLAFTIAGALGQPSGLISTALADDGDGGGDDGGEAVGDDGDDGASSGGSSASGGRWDKRTNIKRRSNVRQQLARQRQTRERSRRQPVKWALPSRAANEIISTGLTETQVTQLESLGYQVLERQSLAANAGLLLRLRIPRNQTLEASRQQVSALNQQAIIDFNHFYRSEEGTPDSQISCTSSQCVPAQLISWPVRPGEAGTCATDMVIGLIDTGVNADHATFIPGRLEVIRLSDAKQREPRESHGTAVASILLGSGSTRSPGLVPDARLIAINAFYLDGQDERADAFTLVKAINELRSRDIPVINLSLAGPPNRLLEKTIAQAATDGTVLVAAAGNAGPRAEPAYPAAYENVIAVTAVDSRKRVYRRAGQGQHIDFAAPGVRVWAAASISGARTKSGTSFAVPFVTAAVVLALKGRNAKGVRQIMDILAADAVDLGEPGKDPVFGYGLIQASGLCAR